MAIDKNVEEEKKNAAAREQKMIAVGVQQREATWQAHAEAQAAQQAQAECEQEEAKAAAARDKQRLDQQAAQYREAATRLNCLEVKRRRAARIRCMALAQVHEACDDRRPLSFLWNRRRRLEDTRHALHKHVGLLCGHTRNSPTLLIESCKFDLPPHAPQACGGRSSLHDYIHNVGELPLCPQSNPTCLWRA